MNLDRNSEPKDFIPYFDEIAGQWDGDNAGKGEDRAQVCNEIISLLNELQNI